MAANSLQPPNKRTVGFDCEFVEPPPEKFIQSECPICLYIIREPYQVECCGKKFCKACIKRIKTSKKVCPTCNKKAFSSYSDKGLKQSLYTLEVRCSYKQEGCQWTGELGQFDNHLNTNPQPEKQLEGCQYVEIACTNNCESQIRRKDVANHLINHCPNRSFSCDYCGVYKATYNEVTQIHWPVCGSFPLSCPNKCGSILQRQNLNSHIANECPLTTINCDFHHVGCTVKLSRQEMATHVQTSFLAHISLLASSHANLMTENRQLKAKIAELEQPLNTAIPLGCSIPLGPPIFTMTNYQQHKSEDDHWYSPGIYTHLRGYKICLRVVANGLFNGKGTHISVYVHFMKGEFDDTLKWPFRGTISYQLLDQASGTDHKTFTLIYYNSNTMSNDIGGRVTEGERAIRGLGSRRFVAHSELNPKYLHNDTLFFQIYKIEVREN